MENDIIKSGRHDLIRETARCHNITTSNVSRNTPVSPSDNIIPVTTPTQVSPIIINPNTAGTMSYEILKH